MSFFIAAAAGLTIWSGTGESAAQGPRPIPSGISLPAPGTDLALALREVRAGLGDRERALGLADELESLDLRELALWEALLPALANLGLAPQALQHEAALRLAVLPMLAVRQRDYRALELELARGLPSVAATVPDPAGVALQIARLASIRAAADVVDQAQRQTRTTLNTLHAVVLARAADAGYRLDAAALHALGQVRERRTPVESALAAANAAWAGQRDSARLDRWENDLRAAAALALAGGDNMRASLVLRQQATAPATPTPMQALLLAASDALQATARTAAMAAGDRAGVGDDQRTSMLADPLRVDAADEAMAPLFAEIRRLAGSLRVSLAARAATVNELISLAAERERLLGAATYLSPSEDQRLAWAAVQDAANAARQEVATLQAAAGDIATARSGLRALAIEQLAAKLEELVGLDDQGHALALGQLLDLRPRPAEPRLGAAAAQWSRDVDALQALDARRTAWRKAWDQRGLHEEELFAALRMSSARVQRLWQARLVELVQSLPAAVADDDVSRLAMAIVGDAGKQVQALAGLDNELHRAQANAEADPVVGALWESSGAFRWSLASAGLRELPQFLDRTGRLRAAGSQLAAALNRSLPAAQRLAALLPLSETLGLPWMAVGDGADLEIATESHGEAYMLGGLGRNTPELRRQREFFVGAPLRVAALSLRSLQLAQAGAAQTAPATPSLPWRAGARVLGHAYNDVAQSWWVYLLMPTAGFVGGGLLGVPGGLPGMGAGATAGGGAGLATMGVAIAEDAAFGGLKGLVTGAARVVQRELPPESRGGQIDSYARWVEKGAPEWIDYLKASIALKNIGTKLWATRVNPVAERAAADLARRVVQLDRWVQPEAVGNLARNIARGERAARDAESFVREATSRLHSLPMVQRLDMVRAIRNAEATANSTRQVLVLMRALAEALQAEQQIARLAPGTAAVLAALSNGLSKIPYGLSKIPPDIFKQLNDLRGPDNKYFDLMVYALIDVLQRGPSAAADPSSATATTPGAGTAAPDPQADQALSGYRGAAQQRSTESTQRSAAAAVGPTRRSSAEQMRAAMERDQIIPHEWETKEGLDTLRRMREQEKKEKEQKEKEEKDKKDKDEKLVQDGTKTPIKPVTPPIEPDPTKTDSAGSEKTGWWGFEAVISYKYKGASCTQTLSGEVFGTRAEAEQAMRDDTARAMRADAGNRNEVVPIRQRIYTGPVQSRPTYTGPTGTKAVQCVSVPTTTPSPTAPPAVPSVAKYEPKGSGQPCPQLRQQMMDRCSQMEKDEVKRNCASGATGCSVGGPGCGGTFGDYVGWCTLHPSYEPLLAAGLTMFVSEIKACIELFLGDSKPGRQERGIECQRKAQQKLEAKKGPWVQQACQARCAQDGRSGTATLGGGRHMCECR